MSNSAQDDADLPLESFKSKQKIAYANGDVYEGSVERGLRSGRGVLVCEDGRKYRGQFYQDLPHGQGEERTSDNAVYRGEFRNGHRDGTGTEMNEQGHEYSGEWKDGMRHGSGDYFQDGLYYQGEWKEGNRHGYGVCMFQNGDLYEGEFVADLMEGSGCMVMANGSRYDGVWKAGKMSGKGKMIYSNGDVYEGLWSDGKREGQGSYFSAATESEYVGEFKKGKRHGYGKQQYVVAAWSNVKTSHIPYKTSLSETYEGEWSSGRKNGFGRIMVKSRKVFEGQFSGDSKHGEGIEFLDDGSTFKSLWKDGVSQGKGILRLSDGTCVRGYWEGEHFREAAQEKFIPREEMKEAEEADGLIEFFERGKQRILKGNQQPEVDAGVAKAPDTLNMSGAQAVLHDRALLSSMGGLHDIEEVDEDQMVDSGSHGPTPIPSNNPRLQGRASSKSSPYSPLPVAEAKSSSTAPTFHEDVVDIAKRLDVRIRGTYDEEGNYLPPVSMETLREWNVANLEYTSKREELKEKGIRAPDLSGETWRGSFQQDKANLSLSGALKAAAGEFSFERWRQERGLT
uniref:Uncharacterized protein n=1 Tax=Guillardia theta TaxID=55529 RepID=A0A7S4K7I3_GUITH|mmetsp:Transcript_21651/g.71641  ORF Transcript_21651/g.71641 Transcript_21651/m.71641 type:complete len:567 (+) Transcript_21651:258-1958(+)